MKIWKPEWICLQRKPSSPFFNGCEIWKVPKSLSDTWAGCFENSHHFCLAIKCAKNLSTWVGGGSNVGFLLSHFFFLISNPLGSSSTPTVRAPHHYPELTGTFLETGPSAFPRGNGCGKGGEGRNRARGWPELRDPGLGLWVLPLVEFSPPRPLPFNPTPRQLRNPGADWRTRTRTALPARKLLCHQQPDGKYGLYRWHGNRTKVSLAPSQESSYRRPLPHGTWQTWTGSPARRIRRSFLRAALTPAAAAAKEGGRAARTNRLKMAENVLSFYLATQCAWIGPENKGTAY